ncbi:CoA-binding protein [Pseudohalioglobus sediminis]|uniref:CoA-binding protein n=1 Tax=Pseudohalioglobus sediminis TaxID=2606449 RepID=A0A5B0X029_9GAMM|nr:CoA-binding protein [Pseudohalioglobus sediminis]KAA1191948.1 CoA-binding protein [Pseudohalioglobus sediminis]
MPLTEDRDIARILATTRTIALLGASHKPQRPSHRVMRFLLAQGYQVYPVNPGLAGQELLGCRVYPDLAAIPVKIDMVDVFRQSKFLPQIVSEAVNAGIGVIWTQLGVMHAEAIAAAETAGMSVVADRCPAIELPRLEKLGLCCR